MHDASQNESQPSLSLRPLRVGSMEIGVPDDQVLTVVEWREPIPLPFAPQTLFGIVSVQGRMFTVLDTAKLLGLGSITQESILVLRGREQLALAISGSGQTIEIAATDVQPVAEFPLSNGVVMHEGRRINILATERLFATALQGHERRRRRF